MNTHTSHSKQCSARERRLLLALVGLLSIVPLVGMGAAPASAAASVPFSDTPTQSWGADGRVRAITEIDGIAYIGGHFTALTSRDGSQSRQRNRLGAINQATGQPTSWNPNANAKVWAMVPSPDGSSIFVGGAFTTVDGKTRKRVAEIDTATGNVTDFRVNIPSGVRALALSPSGDRLYIGGVFRRVNGQSQKYIAAVHTSDGTLVGNWRPTVEQVGGACPPRCEPEVTSIAINSGDTTVYFGGHFGSVNGTARNNAAAVARSGGALRPWNPNVFNADPNNPNQRNLVNGITISENPDRVFLCGDFWRVDGKASPNLGAVDPITGDKQNWVASTDGGTPDCLVHDGILYLGGHFQRVGGRIAKNDGVDRNHIAALDVRTAEVLPWDPNANSVLGLHVINVGTSPGGDLMAGGDFTRIGGKRQHRFATFERAGSPPPPPPPPPPSGDFVFEGSGSASGNAWSTYEFPVSAGDAIDVELDWANGSADLRLFLRDPSGNQVARDTSSARPKQVSATAGVGGTWSVGVRVRSGSTSYTVAVDVEPAPPGETFSFSSSGGANSNRWQVFEFPVSAGDDIDAVLDWGNGSADLRMFLRNPSGNQVARDTSSARPKRVSATAGVGGTWSIGVRIRSGWTRFDVEVELS